MGSCLGTWNPKTYTLTYVPWNLGGHGALEDYFLNFLHEQRGGHTSMEREFHILILHFQIQQQGIGFSGFPACSGLF